MTVGDLCTHPVISISPTDAIQQAAERMRDHHVGTLVVCDPARHPVGILTDRDIVVSAVAQSPEQLPRLTAGDLMTREPVTVRAGEAIEDAMKKMRVHGVRRLPVLDDDGRLTGLLSLDDLLRVVAKELGRVADRENVREYVTRP